MSIELLRKFAHAQNIDSKEVNKFLAQYENPKTLDELTSLPESLLNHISFISYVKEPLKSFIKDEMWCERYMTIDLESVADCLYDRAYNLVDSDEVDINDIGIENLTTDNEDAKEELKQLKSVAKHLVDIKFGSVVYDW